VADVTPLMGSGTITNVLMLIDTAILA